MSAAVDVDLLDPGLHARGELDAYWRRMRRDDPVSRHPVGGGARAFWAVARHADAQAVVRDTRRFTSAGGNMLGTLLGGGDPAAGRMVVVTDGPFHTALRRLLARGFGPRALGPVARTVERATRALLGAFVERGGGDFVAEVAARIPLRAICELLGVPTADQERVLRLTNAAMLTEQSSDAAAEPAIEQRIARNEILLYYTRLAAERRQAPGSDIISLLVEPGPEGRSLTDEEVLLNCYNLIIGGDETARLAMAEGIRALTEHPDQWQRLRDEPELTVSGTEEILRWSTPVVHIGRRATHDTELAGRTIAAGDVVTVWNTSANRDEAAFADPGIFDLARQPNQHLTFGYGPHFCVGAELARIEIRALLTELRRTVSAVEVVGPVPALVSNFLRGPAALPVALTPKKQPQESS
ncbi:cytochrome P450 [Streptomyces sp. NPDC046805]|uniref:cytochrome P450 n=1 Tax=Streptomyces sp. NPDC046805 TaxID=3155134 RepID=UPI0033E72C4E